MNCREFLKTSEYKLKTKRVIPQKLPEKIALTTFREPYQKISAHIHKFPRHFRWSFQDFHLQKQGKYDKMCRNIYSYKLKAFQKSEKLIDMSQDSGIDRCSFT